MRLRNVKNKEEIMNNSNYLVKNYYDYKGKWRELFNNDNPIYIEIGMGKGRFLMELAEKNPDIHYIGIEKYSSVLVRALEKMEENPLENLHFIRMDAEEIVNIFEKNDANLNY